ncbi:MAG: phage antirepressor [Paludibacter sp.]
MEALRIFNNPQFGEIRTSIIDEQPYFVANDIAKILGYSYPANAIQDHVDEDDKIIVQLADIQDVDKTPHLKGSKITVINESGLYALVFGSKLEGARQFKKWVTSEVLPSIRKNGMYATDITVDKMISDPDFAIQLLTNLKEEKQKRIHAEQTVKEQAPKALFADAVATSTASCLVGELSKILRQNGVEVGQNRLFDYMRKNGYLCQFGERYNQPTQRAMEMELFEVKKTSINKPDGTIMVTTTTKVTGKGQIYFVNKLLKSK